MREERSVAGPAREPVRVAEFMACLSVATDLAMGYPSDYALSACVVAVRLGDALKWDAGTLQDAYYETLLRFLGCNADTHWFASIVGDEIALRAEYAEVDSADIPAVLQVVRRSVERASPEADAQGIERAMARALEALPEVLTSFFPGHCEVARRLSARMGFPKSFVDTVGQIYARWDGKGVPALSGEAISPALLGASLAHDIVTFNRLGGVESATAMARQRRGGAHSPEMVDVFCANARSILSGLDAPPRWQDVLDLEPGSRRVFDESGLDAAFEAVADFSDIKSPWFLGHSRRVASLAAQAAANYGLPEADADAVRRAGLAHDIGKVGVSAGTWAEAGPLTEREWEAVRLHPYPRRPRVLSVAAAGRNRRHGGAPPRTAGRQRVLPQPAGAHVAGRIPRSRGSQPVSVAGRRAPAPTGFVP